MTVGCEAESDDIVNINIVFTGDNLNQMQVENVNRNALKMTADSEFEILEIRDTLKPERCLNLNACTLGQFSEHGFKNLNLAKFSSSYSALPWHVKPTSESIRSRVS